MVLYIVRETVSEVRKRMARRMPSLERSNGGAIMRVQEAYVRGDCVMRKGLCGGEKR